MKKSVIIIVLIITVLAIIGVVIAIVNNNLVSKNNDIDTKIYGTITDITNDYLVISCTKTTPSVKKGDLAHVSLTNDPTIQGSFNLIVGQQIEVEPTRIQEIYPIQIFTDKIVISVN